MNFWVLAARHNNRNKPQWTHVLLNISTAKLFLEKR